MNTKLNAYQEKPLYKIPDYLIILFIASSYFLAHYVAFLFPEPNNVLMAVWPAGGIGLAALLLNNRKLWPYILAALFIAGNLANLLIHRPWMISLGFMTANIMETSACAYFLTNACGDNIKFNRFKEIISLFLASTIINAFSACVGAGFAFLNTKASFWSSWSTWWIADGLGILIITPFIVSWMRSTNFRFQKQASFYTERIIFILIWISAILLVFNHLHIPQHFHIYPYMLITLLAWPAIRLDERYVLLALILLTVIAIHCAWQGCTFRLFDHENLENRLMIIQLYLGFTATSGLFLTAVFSERKITENNLKENQRLLNNIIENTSDAVYVKDIMGRYTLLNNAAIQYIGKNSKEVIGKDDTFLFPLNEARESIAEDKQVISEQKTRSFDETLTTADGITRAFSSTKGPIFDDEGHVIGTFGITRDITKKTQKEALLELAKKNAESANQLKSEFLNNISHDFRTPIHAIKGLSTLLMSEKFTPKQLKIISGINKAAAELSVMVEELLNAARLDSGKIELSAKEFDVYECVNSFVAMFEAHLIGRNLKLICNIEPNIPKLKGDTIKLGQIIMNLLGNAIKYTDKGEIAIIVERDTSLNDNNKCRLNFTFKDTGLGIPWDKISHIFDPFTRYHEFSGGKVREGVGLGLYITQSIVHLMKGNIRVNSEVGTGSEFIVTLDFDKIEPVNT